MKPRRGALEDLGLHRVMISALGIGAMLTGLLMLSWQWALVVLGLIVVAVAGQQFQSGTGRMLGLGISAVGLAFVLPALALIVGGLIAIGSSE